MQSAKAGRPACLSPSLFVFVYHFTREGSKHKHTILFDASPSTHVIHLRTERKRYSYVRHTGTSARVVRVTSGHAESCAATYSYHNAGFVKR
ncbi:uncharacterized protein N7525_011173 [Penicillium rubens]|jgi:hypothetical protein|uniref:uncharacterized protein n=1 Tax=Penicillium rubens TaxID=1108849 RepID=UPI002A59B318|nr:uncharacterized protein N7525_011173 [Penicillium rubens]KAJ5821889.1 hypothetical protein N7525_011173 [Penicillium rubens]KAJ5859531.1 hypothetical protein N7534_004808 [Penicillium rubens]